MVGDRLEPPRVGFEAKLVARQLAALLGVEYGSWLGSEFLTLTEPHNIKLSKK